MRKALVALIVLSAAFFAAPSSTAAPGAAGGAPADTTAGRAAPAELRGDAARFRQRVVTLTNNRRRNHGCRALARHSALDRAAQTHTRKMANRNRLSHQLPGEPSVGVRVRRAGYNWTLVGENIAAGYSTPAAVVRAWMGSRGHRRNILKCAYRHIGVGYAVSDRGVPYWTQVFGRQ